MPIAAPTYAELLERSRALPYAFPTVANRLVRFADRGDEVEAHAGAVRPILHSDVLGLMDGFLATLRQVGTPAERELYAEMDRAAFMTRLLARRPLAFLTGADSYLLRDGTRGEGGFEAIGTPGEASPQNLTELLSYDEMAIAALVGVSVPTHFINAGGRDNGGEPGVPGSFVERGVYTGLVGARFERPERMEWQQLVVTRAQNTAAKGYGQEADPETRATRLRREWARCLGRQTLPTYAEALEDGSGRYIELAGGGWLDADLYRRRMRLSIEPFLLDANARAQAQGREAYVHIVGLGLGVWEVHPQQSAWMLQVYAELLRELELAHVADLDFSWFGDESTCGGVGDGQPFPTPVRSIRIHFSRREPAAPLAKADAEKLVVAMYAWDGNSFPGNEYWMGSLSASGDPAAACCSMIPDLQNPDVNPRVSGEFTVSYGG